MDFLSIELAATASLGLLSLAVVWNRNTIIKSLRFLKDLVEYKIRKHKHKRHRPCVEDRGKDGAVVTYILDGVLYKMYVRKRRTQHPKVLLVLDGEGEDVSEQVLPFLGPSRDWHSTALTPSFWNKDLLSFEISTGKNHTFSREDVIHGFGS